MLLTKDFTWITNLTNVHHFSIADGFWIQSQKTWVFYFNCRSFAVWHSMSAQTSLVLGSRVQWPGAELYSWQIWKLAPARAVTGVWPLAHEPPLSLGPRVFHGNHSWSLHAIGLLMKNFTSVAFCSAWHIVIVPTLACCYLCYLSFQLGNGRHNAHPTHFRVVDSDEIM